MMDNYDVIGLVGEGSFGRVYKAKRKIDGETVALKVIRKRGRSQKELKGLRRECEIQQHLNHPNIIQMLDSFETENEIVVITEFAHKELHIILGKEGFLQEDRVRVIVWDLVSALYYLHSHRVLHRDLKPQNILLDAKGTAKLCDFGFARNMSTGTYVLTSIKGTPLYMAPELIDECPYDHMADLWSLGCIIYEMLVGAPPFCTSSILHLISLIRHEQIQWPGFISPNCVSFLKGLLQKDPSKRMTWPEILVHPFVAGHVLITDDTQNMPLTQPLSSCQLRAKEKQRNDLTAKSNMPNKSEKGNQKKGGTCPNNSVDNPCTNRTSSEDENESDKCPNRTAQSLSIPNTVKQEKKTNHVTKSEGSKVSLDSKSIKKTIGTNNPTSRDTHLTKLSQNLENFSKKINSSSSEQISKKTLEFDRKLSNVDLGQNVDWKALNSSDNKENSVIEEERIEASKDKSSSKTSTKINTLANWEFGDSQQPIECEEWLAFLQKSMREIASGELTSISQPNLAYVIITPLRNPAANASVIENVACLLSLPFVIHGAHEDSLHQIRNVYIEIKLVPNLLYAAQLITRVRVDESSNSSDTPTNASQISAMEEPCRSMSDLSADELQSLESIFVLICNLMHQGPLFTSQFCDAVVVLNTVNMLRKLLSLTKRKLRIVTDIIAILTRILSILPENAELVEKIILTKSEEKSNNIDLVALLRHSSSMLRTRVCILLRLLARFNCRALQLNWNSRIKDTLEALIYDSIESVRNAAEESVEELRHLVFYDQIED